MHTQLPWFSINDSADCPQFRAYMAALTVMPLLTTVLALGPGLVRGARLINTAVPRAGVTLLFLRLAPLLHAVTAWSAISMLYQLLGNVLLMIGGLVFVGAFTVVLAAYGGFTSFGAPVLALEL